jgi:hypothetical protein
MRYLTIIIILLSAFPFKVLSEENTDSISFRTTQKITLSDSIANLLRNNTLKLDSLINENTALKGLLKSAQKETEMKERDIINLQRKVDDLQNITIKRLEASNDTLQRRLISMASNFLYIPYDEYSIEEIALPAFLSTKGTPAYVRYQNRLPLLQNYKDDISSLITFLTQAEKDLSIGFTRFREDKAKEHLSNIQTLPLYLRYSSYDDWKNTYLGTQICTIKKYLQTPTDGTSNQLKAIRTKLERLLNIN